MAGGVYLSPGDGQLVEMTKQPYDSEDLLQRMLAEDPNLLAGEFYDSTKNNLTILWLLANISSAAWFCVVRRIDARRDKPASID